MDELVSTLPPLYLLLKHHAADLSSKDGLTRLKQLLLWVDLRCRATSMWQIYNNNKKKETLKPSLDPSILAWGICCFLNLCFFDCCCSLVIRRCLLVGLWVCCFACVCVCVPVGAHLRERVRAMFGERTREPDSHDSYFNLFREYCCTGAVHWVAPACQVCLIMQKEQKNALQMSDFLPKELWQTFWTLRERWCKPHFCWI